MTVLPKTEGELMQMIVNAAISRAYTELRAVVGDAAARRIEARVLALLPEPGEFASEFKTFQSELAVTKARQLVEQFFEAAHAG